MPRQHWRSLLQPSNLPAAWLQEPCNTAALLLLSVVACLVWQAGAVWPDGDHLHIIPDAHMNGGEGQDASLPMGRAVLVMEAVCHQA